MFPLLSLNSNEERGNEKNIDNSFSKLSAA
ncbi:hypothetical protein DZE40_001141 [Clostridium beijerinckii]|uniref:Uncharacterized protein n=1 Tax=Clostridium beijerinckii TaxID=1520 RepID=A0A1S8S697_CLOBE|nr:hypothetical protein [Clostridium beijerinckii]OOM60902.1 hypothetical protein CLBCK_26190 [Clostridium beijerinckii]